jgi:hypothetical protein
VLGYAHSNMKRMLRFALGTLLFCTALAAVGVLGCDSESDRNASATAPVAPDAATEGETLSDLVREKLTDILRDPDAFSRARRLGALLPTLGPEHIASAKQTLEDTSLDFGGTELELLVRYWAIHEPEHASRWAVEKAPPGLRIAIIMAALPYWAEAEPQRAAAACEEWAAQRADLSDAVQIALVRGWFAADPTELAQYIHDLEMGFVRQRSLSTYLRAMIQADGIEAATRWAESVPDDDAVYKTAVYRQVASAVPLFDQAAALRWCDAHCEGPFGLNLRSILARRWVRSAGAPALEWLSTAPENHENNLAIRATFALWVRTDREAVLDWMAGQSADEPESWLRPALPVYAKLIAESSPAEAIVWAERIEADEEREIILTEIARAWHEADEAACEAWLLQSSLSEEARAKVRPPNS